jgi:hypothetical protein
MRLLLFELVGATETMNRPEPSLKVCFGGGVAREL